MRQEPSVMRHAPRGGRRLALPGLFDWSAPAYDLLTRGARWDRRAEALAAHLPAPATGRPLRILDVGTGTGSSALALARRAPGAQVVGLERAAAMLARARRNLRAQAEGAAVRLVQGDALALCVRDGAFDAVTGHSLLYLLPDRARALSEFRRVLRPGGRLVLMEPRRGVRLGHLRRWREPIHLATMVAWRSVSLWRGRFDREGLSRLVSEAGLKVVSVETALDGLGLLLTAERLA